MLGRLKEKARSGTGSYARHNYVGTLGSVLAMPQGAVTIR